MGIDNILGEKKEIMAVLDYLSIRKGDKPIDPPEVSKYAHYKYSPNDFMPPDMMVKQYLCTLGRCEWEIIAAQIVEKSKEKGKWSPITAEEANGYLEQEMIDVGYLEETNEGYMLTEKALGQIAMRYLKIKLD